MKYFLDSAKLDEIKYAYNTFGIDGVTTNPRHIMLSGKPFLPAITDIARLGGDQPPSGRHRRDDRRRQEGFRHQR